MRQFAAYILITVGILALWQAGIGTAAWIGCTKVSGFAACGAPAKEATDLIGSLITLGLGLLYQNQKKP